jgi:cysteine-rich repeat protein
MKQHVFRALSLTAVIVGACATAAPSKQDDYCYPRNDYFFCSCRDGSSGRKKCNADGSAFGPCEGCNDDAQVICQPGDVVPCACADGSMSGRKACNLSGSGFEQACLGCPDVGGGGGGRGGAGGGDAGGGAGSTSTSCGNGVAEAGEQCDDGNALGGDFCSNACKVTLAANGGGCANGQPGGGVPVHVFADPVVIDGDTSNTGLNASAPDGVDPSCVGETETQSAASPDVIFAVVPHASGTLSATLSPTDTTFDSMLYVRQGACDAAATFCRDVFSNGGGQSTGESLSIPVVADEPVWVVVDGFGADQKGPFRLTLSVRN